MQRITSFQQARDVLEQFRLAQVPRVVYTLEYVRQFMDFLGNPQDNLRVIHVAGTSGKTSTCYYIAALLQQSGKRVGLLISPHIEEINERVCIDLTPLPERQFCEEFTVFMNLAAESGLSLTYHELLYAFAYWEFARSGVDYAVIETGMGGLLDATNVATRADKICVITDIGLDHVQRLGNNVHEVAAHKAGIIHLRNTVFCYAQDAETMHAISTRTRQKQADLHIVEQTGLPKRYALLPLFQQRNFGLARTVVRFVQWRDHRKPLNAAAALRAAQVHIPGRMETFCIGNKTVILDGAHNAQKLAAFKASLQQQFPQEKPAVLLACTARRPSSVEDITREVTSFASHIIATQLSQASTHDSEDAAVVAATSKTHGFWGTEVITDPVRAWRELLARPERLLVVTGSFYLLQQIHPLARAAAQVVT